MVNKYRRKFLAGSAALLCTPFIQGCGPRKPDIDGSDFNIHCDDSFYPVFDTHAHFFNASDLQAGGYLAGPVLNDMVRWYPNRGAFRRLAEFLGELIQSFGGGIARSASSEYEHLSSRASALTETSRFELLQKEADDDIDRVSKEFFMSLEPEQQSKLNSLYIEAQNEEYDLLDSTGLAFIKDVKPFDENTIADALNEEPFQITGDIDNIGKANKILKVITAIQFVGRMLTWRSSNLTAFHRAYSGGRGASIIRVADVTVDFDHWLGEDYPRSTMADQIKLHELIHQITGGYNVPLLGVNPVKVLIEGKKYLDLIDDTLSRGVYKGVKLYPTLGYSPYGEVVSDALDYLWFPVGYPVPGQQELAKAMVEACDDIYRICMSHDCVVMAHSKNSKGISKEARELASASYWAKVLSRNEFRRLKVNFGHLGDISSGSVSILENSWTREFVKLLREYENAYGDVGYWFELRDEDYLKDFVGTLRELGGGDIFSKVMYGSDWYMINMENGWHSYLSATYKTFRQSVDKGDIKEDEMTKMFLLNADDVFGGVPNSCKVNAT